MKVFQGALLVIAFMFGMGALVTALGYLGLTKVSGMEPKDCIWIIKNYTLPSAGFSLLLLAVYMVWKGHA